MPSEELSSQAESMNDIVADLVALAGGANKATGSKTSSQTRSRGLSQSDRMYHHIADGPKAQTPSHASAMEKAIPLDNDSDFDSFNT